MTHYTSKEQSKRLLELGLSPETSDMYYELLNEDPYPQPVRLPLSSRHWEQLLPDVMIPCWSLGALIELLPERIHLRDWMNYKLVLGKHKAFYLRIEDLKESRTILPKCEAESLLDAVYQMFCILLEKGYIKKGE